MFPERRDDDHPGDRRRSISNRAKLGWMHRTERDTRRDVINGIRTPLKGRRSSFVIVSIALYIRVNSFPMFVTMELIIKLVRINRREKERESRYSRETPVLRSHERVSSFVHLFLSRHRLFTTM